MDRRAERRQPGCNSPAEVATSDETVVVHVLARKRHPNADLARNPPPLKHRRCDTVAGGVNLIATVADDKNRMPRLPILAAVVVAQIGRASCRERVCQYV